MKFLIMLIVALVMSAVGFKRFVWFISIGYGYAVAGLGVCMLVMFRHSLSAVTVILSILCIIYGLRLGTYLMVRELKSASYKTTMKNDIKDGESTGFILKIVVWVSCALLYCLEVSPAFFRMSHGSETDGAAIAGTVIMALGIITESAADFTKNRFKKAHPHDFCNVGLFKIVRCPNYFGEIMIWTGMFISGVTAFSGAIEWIAAIAGWACIVYIMFGGARRLEIRQNKNYGDNTEYQKYVKSTPIMIPLIPLYSVAKYKWLVG